jgi:BatD DUF11 like domain
MVDRKISMFETRVVFRIALVAVVALFVGDFARADSPSVTAVLSNSEVAVGQTVRLQIRVMGSRSAETPETINVDGLQIHRTGTEQHFEMNNMTVSSSVIYDYTVLPEKAGTFKIPSQTIRAGSTSLATPELTLHVAGFSGRQAAPNRGSSGSNVNAGKLVFAELIVPKKSAYVGETIPIVIRIGFFARGQLVELPELTGQGFTMQKFQMQDQPQVESIDGRRCEVLTFKTAIAAVRSGKLDIGPVQATAVVRVPQERRQRGPRSPFDIFNMDDPFSDPFFADPFGTFGQQEKLTIRSDSVALEVKPLPSNPPANFAGAIGNFSMTVDANPKSLQVGDPITVTAAISGRGNFDRVTAPAPEDERGWHKYPPSSKFKQDDDVGISGAKTFETVLSPNEKKQMMSPFLFSFFDPVKEHYVTLKSDAIPIRVEGGTVVAAAPATQPGSATPATVATPAAAPAKPTPKQQDILYQLTDRPARAQLFIPQYARSSFWLAQVIPLFALLGFVGWKTRRIRMDNREAQRIAALHHESVELMRKLRREDASPHEYYLNASRAVQVKTALAKNVEPNAVDVEMAGAAFQLDENSRRQLHQLFARSDELRYSGAHNGGRIVSPESRREVLNLIEHLRT